MEQKLLIYNTLTRTKERFTPLHAPNVGMYVSLSPVQKSIGDFVAFRHIAYLSYKAG